MVTKIKTIKEFSVDNKPLIVGLPGMGRVGYVSVNYLLSRVGGELVAEVYSTSFPPQLLVGRGGLSTLFVGRIYDAGKFLVFTGDAQPQSPEGQNELCDALLNYLSSKGTLDAVIATAAYVVPEFNEKRRVFITGNQAEFIEELKNVGGEVLNEGVITGVNGVIVGWAGYYGIRGAVALGETWSAVVEFDETDYRAVKAVISLLNKYLNINIDPEPLTSLATVVESRINAAIAQMSRVARRETRESREVM